MQQKIFYSSVFFIFSSCLCLHIQVFAQDFIFSFDNTPKFNIEDKTLKNAWSGGLNSPQFAQIHLNNDKLEDLVIFERTSSRIYTFLAKKEGKKYTYKHVPSYENFFPKLKGWFVLADFDQDDKKDIFTHSNFGIKVFKNISQNSRTLKWELFIDPVKTKGYSREINLQVNIMDIPAIVDLDNDGDLDILTFDFASGSYIEYHENQSIELHKNTEKLEFIRKTSCWGGIYEGANCGEFRFDYDCQKPKRGKGNAPPRAMHVGSTLKVMDVNGDKIKDLLIGDVSCSEIFTMINLGTNKKPKFENYTIDFPKSKPIDMSVFPAVFDLDINFDKKKDLIISPNVFYNDKNQIDFKNSIWLYLNKGKKHQTSFEFQTNAFLQNDMIDVGENAYPVFFDYNNDGYLDLLIANKGEKKDGIFRSNLYYFEKNYIKKEFKLIKNNFLDLSKYQFTDIRPQTVDINNDGKDDLCFVVNHNRQTRFYYINPKKGNLEKLDLPIKYYEFPYLIDLDNDKDLDLLVGTRRGKLKYFENKNNTFELINDNLGKINHQTIINFDIGDLNNNGILDLVVGDAKGKLKIYPDFTQKFDEKWQAKTNFILNEISLHYESFNLGKNLFPTLIDIDRDKKLDIVIGTNTGGLILLKNKLLK